MQFKIRDIGDEGLDVRLVVGGDFLAAECAGVDARPGADGLVLTGRLSRSGDDFLLRGKLAGGLLVSCARCLEDATVPVAADMTVCYVDRETASKGDEEEDDDVPDVVPIKDGTIDLAPEVRDEILLALPVSPLCAEGCLGLCVVCGGNRNQRACDCGEKQRAATSKFAALQKLKR
jgi:uncharacterized protein